MLLSPNNNNTDTTIQAFNPQKICTKICSTETFIKCQDWPALWCRRLITALWTARSYKQTMSWSWSVPARQRKGDGIVPVKCVLVKQAFATVKKKEVITTVHLLCNIFTSSMKLAGCQMKFTRTTNMHLNPKDSFPQNEMYRNYFTYHLCDCPQQPLNFFFFFNYKDIFIFLMRE